MGPVKPVWWKPHYQMEWIFTLGVIADVFGMADVTLHLTRAYTREETSFLLVAVGIFAATIYLYPVREPPRPPGG